MGLVLSVLTNLFIIIFVLLAMIFFIPVVYSVEGAKEEQYFFTIRISWLWKAINIIVNKKENKKIEFFMSIFGFRIPLHNREEAQKRSKKKEIKKTDKARKKIKKDFNRYFSFLRRSFLDKSLLFIRRVLRHVLPKQFRLHLIYGFEDPSDTGMLTGLFFMLFPNISNSDIMRIYPVFDEEIIQGEISIEGKIILAVIIFCFLQFYFAEGVRHTLRKIRNK